MPLPTAISGSSRVASSDTTIAGDSEFQNTFSSLPSIPCEGECACCCGDHEHLVTRIDAETGLVIQHDDLASSSADIEVAPDPVSAIEGLIPLLGLDQQNIKIWFGDEDYLSQAEPFGKNGEWVGQKDWTGSARTSVWTALDDIESLINVNFVEASSAEEADLDFIFNNNGLSFGSTGSIIYDDTDEGWVEATIRLNHTRMQRWALGHDPGGQGYETLVHEIGHALGLDHTHDGNFGSGIIAGIEDTGAFSGGTLGINDPINSIMAHRDGWAEMDTSRIEYGNRITMGAWDIQALINRYGANTDTATGNDTYILPHKNVLGTGFSTIFDNGGVDTISAGNRAFSAVIDLRAATLDYNPETTGGPVSHFLDNTGDVIAGGYTIAANSRVENAIGSRKDDSITGNSFANDLEGGDGDDLILGGAGNDDITGGNGADSMTGGGGADAFILFGADAHGDLITDFSDADIIEFYGDFESSDFRFTEIGGRTQIALDADGNGSRETRLEIDGLVADALTLTHNQAGTKTTIELGDASNVIEVLYGTNKSDVLIASSADEWIDALNGNDSLNGKQGYDSLLGGLGNDTIRGHDDDDTVEGGGGADRIYGDAGDDLLLGGAGLDRIEGGTGDDTIDGGAGNDFLKGLSGDDVIADASGDNRIFGHGGADSLRGGNRDDTIKGGVGSDTLDGNDGEDRLEGEEGSDRIFGGDGDDSIDGGSDNDVLRGESGIDRIDGGSGNDEIRGGNGGDSLIGKSGNDEIFGENGNDRINAGIGDDLLLGGNGNDFLRAGDGADTIDGGRGADEMEGGLGDDVFVFSRGDDESSIVDFDRKGDDIISLDGFGNAYNTFAEVMEVAEQIGGNTVAIDFGSGDVLTLEKTSLGNLSADDFDFG